MKILFAASEVYPLIKTGGLGDVMHSLPSALAELGDDVRIVIPAYESVISKVENIVDAGEMIVQGSGRMHQVRILQASHESLNMPVMLIDIPVLYSRKGNPYVDENGHNWVDNAERFAVFSRCVAMLATGQADTGWKPDVVHCNDWQTGLVPAFLSQYETDIKTVFTIHNLSYAGHFSYATFEQLGLPAEWWSPDSVEFYGNFSMLKAGLIYSHWITTVSPSYADEICTPDGGNGYDGILNHLSYKLIGILNGVDYKIWNPQTDEFIARHYSLTHQRIVGKKENKKSLLEHFDLPDTSAPVFGFVGRMVEQKGVDLIVSVIPHLIEHTDAMFVLLGTGQLEYQQQLQNLAKQYPERMGLSIGYSEEIAHKIEAGADAFLMPSRFEPCGLNQMYSLKYGTPPIVRYTGGLADTVVDANDETIKNKTATGFVFNKIDADELLQAINRCINVFKKEKLWGQVCRTAMQQDYSWTHSAHEYEKLYKKQTTSGL